MVKMPLYKYKDVSTPSGMEHLEDIIQNDRLHCAYYEQLNDAFEGAYEYCPAHETSVHVLGDDHVERLRTEKGGLRSMPRKYDKSALCHMSVYGTTGYPHKDE
ncbi:MAG: hypothetical protein LBL86_10275 [Coriobacteriales bacterium]|jgi:hypothetical protein|nr:hypothetical protein [Coriobacteriales bacterium]